MNRKITVNHTFGFIFSFTFSFTGEDSFSFTFSFTGEDSKVNLLC